MGHAVGHRRILEDPLQDDVRGGRRIGSHGDLEIEQACDLRECSSRLVHARDRLAVMSRIELTCQLRAATLHGTVDDPSAPRSRLRRRPDAPAELDEAVPSVVDSTDPDEPPTGRVDLTGLSIAGITRRRVGWVSAGLVAVWIVVLFARQVGDAQAAIQPGRAARRGQRRPVRRGRRAPEGARPDRAAEVRRPGGARPSLRQPEGDPVHPGSVGGGPGRRRARLGVRASRRLYGSPDAARIVAVAALRAIGLTA